MQGTPAQDTSEAERPPDFAEYFTSRRLMASDDREAMALSYRLRYEVYCTECHFLNAADYPAHLEQDNRDEDALHALAFDLQGGLVGYSRLVLPDSQGRFPWQAHCVELLPNVTLPPLVESAEVSRLMVRRDYRRRRGDILQGINLGQAEVSPDESKERRRRRPQILLSLYRQMYLHSCRQGLRYWYAAMEKSLAGALSMMGFPFQRIGPESDYFGPVAPYLADLRSLEEMLVREAPDLLVWMKQDPPWPGSQPFLGSRAGSNEDLSGMA